MKNRLTRKYIITGFIILLSIPGVSQVPDTLSWNKDDVVYLLTYDHGGLILWGSEHFRERLRNAVSWLDKYPGFKIGLDNEAQIYDYFSASEPSILEEIKGYLDKYKGRFGIGSCTYGQPLSQFINEESNIRQISYALNATREHFNYRPPVYFMSEHAMHSQIPQILDGFGFKGAIMRTHFMMYGYNPEFDVPIGWWTGIDGSRIATIPTYKGEGAEFGKTPVDNWILTRYPGPECKDSLEQFRKQFAHIKPLIATRADDSGLRQEGLVKKYENNPGFEWILLDELLAKYPEPQIVMKTLPDDFKVRMPWGYCGNEIWNTSRKAEVQVLTAERLAALEFLNGGKNREPGLISSWQNLLLAQHHDVQIVGLLPDAHKLLTSSLKYSGEVLDSSLGFFAENMSGEGVKQVIVFNPLSWPCDVWIKVDLSLSRSEAKGFTVKSGDNIIPSRILQAYKFSDQSIMEGKIIFKAELPPLSVVSYSIIPSPDVPDNKQSGIIFNDSSLEITTPFLDIKLSCDGGIEYIKTMGNGNYISTQGEKAAFFEGTINGENCRSHGRWIIEQPGENAPFITAKEYGFIADIPYQFNITIYEDSPVIDCHVSFDFNGQKIGLVSNDLRDSHSPFVHEEKLRFKFYPYLTDSIVSVRDLPFAISETPDKNVEGNYWTAISDGKTGIAYFNKGNMGSIREKDGSFSIPLAYSMYYIWGTRILNGTYTYDFAIYPFPGNWKEADLHKKAIEYNFPALHLETNPGNGRLGNKVDLLKTDCDNIILSALYNSDDKLFFRFYEYEGKDVIARISVNRKVPEIIEVDLDGNRKGKVKEQLRFKPYQIKTLMIDRP
jgi:alpha-mannosidase